MHIRRAHQDHRHWTEMKIGASSVTTSNLHLRKAALLLLKLKTCRILHAVLILVLVVHPWPVSCSTLNCTIDEIPGVFDGFPACRAGSCRAKYEDKKPYWCDSIRLCVSDRIACNDTDEIPGVPPRSPPPPAEPYCSGAHIRGFDRKTNSCLCEEGWYTTPNPYYCDSPILDRPSVIVICVLAVILSMCILLCYISTVKTVVRCATLGSSRCSDNHETVAAEMISHSN